MSRKCRIAADYLPKVLCLLGTEYRTFILYLGPIVLVDYLPKGLYNHFLLLFCAVTICSTSYHSDKLPITDKLFRDYVEGFISIYGEDKISSNIHNLIHVVDDVVRFGPLPSISSYPFENQLGIIKNLLQNGSPLSQVVKRLAEHAAGNKEINFTTSNQNYPKLLFKEDNPLRKPSAFQPAYKKLFLSKNAIFTCKKPVVPN